MSDARGSAAALELLFAVRPDVFNHNMETVARLQRAVRPSAGYARSLSVLARAKAAGLTTKSGLIVGMGETDDEVVGCLADLAGIGVDIVTIGQYLRPTSHHLPVERWVEPATFADWARVGEASASATSKPARSPAPATTPSPPPTPSHPSPSDSEPPARSAGRARERQRAARRWGVGRSPHGGMAAPGASSAPENRCRLAP